MAAGEREFRSAQALPPPKSDKTDVAAKNDAAFWARGFDYNYTCEFVSD
jgi:hypothetical protein